MVSLIGQGTGTPHTLAIRYDHARNGLRTRATIHCTSARGSVHCSGQLPVHADMMLRAAFGRPVQCLYVRRRRKWNSCAAPSTRALQLRPGVPCPACQIRDSRAIVVCVCTAATCLAGRTTRSSAVHVFTPKLLSTRRA